MEEKELIQKCIDMIVEKVNWGSVDSWTHSHFENLSEEIYKESNIRINSRTIKRIFTKEGKDKSYHPQIETKNAFAMFLGYENWFDFISKRGKKKPYYIFGAFLHSKKTLFTLLGIIIVSVIIYLMSSIQTPCDYEYTFKPVKQEGVIPFNVKFQYDISSIKNDSVFATFGVMSTKFHLEKGKHSFIYTYKTSGVWRVMLWVGDVAIDTTWIYALNNKWETMVTGNQNYYPVKSQKLNSTIFIPLKEVNEIGEILNKKEYWTKYQYTRPFNIDLDNFILHAKIKGDSVNFENLCPDQKIRLVGDQHQKILLHFVNKGCQEYQRSEISEKELHGNQAEYPTFEQNLRHWNVIRYKVKNKKVMLTVNDTSSFSTIYTEPAGKLYTISITSRGQSKIDYIGLFTLNHDTIYWEDFE